MKSLVRAVFRSVGLEINRAVPTKPPAEPSYTALQEFLIQLQRVGFSPKEIYDIGANKGNWTRSVLQVFPDSSYLLVEPQDHLRANIADLLAKPKVSVVHCALSDRPGKAQFLRHAWDVTSHLVTANDSATSSAESETVEVDVKTVTSLIAERGKTPDIIKIDAEGFDLQVLDGSQEAFGVTELFLVEAAVANPDMVNDVRTVTNRMAEADYQLAAILDISTYQWPPHHHSPGLQWLADLAFLKKDGPILKALQKPKRDQLRVVRGW